MIRAVIIDFDDTLCLSEQACFALENETLRRMGREPMTHEAYVKTWGQPIFEIMPVRSPGIVVEAFKPVYYQVCDEFIESGRLDVVPPENYATLDRLKAKRLLVMLLTSRTYGEAKHLMQADHGLASRINAFYYRDNMQYHKPDPRAFAEVLAHHQLRPEECVYVGDTLSDATAAKGAGLHFIASLEGGFRTREDFAEFTDVTFITTFPELDEAVASVDKSIRS